MSSSPQELYRETLSEKTKNQEEEKKGDIATLHTGVDTTVDQTILVRVLETSDFQNSRRYQSKYHPDFPPTGLERDVSSSCASEIPGRLTPRA